MGQLIRQSNLFAAEDWKVIYRSFRNADFRSYDFDTIRSSMLNYVARNYPEEFNDYIHKFKSSLSKVNPKYSPSRIDLPLCDK